MGLLNMEAGFAPAEILEGRQFRHTTQLLGLPYDNQARLILPDKVSDCPPVDKMRAEFMVTDEPVDPFPPKDMRGNLTSSAMMND